MDENLSLEYQGPWNGGQVAMVFADDHQPTEKIVKFIEQETKLEGGWQLEKKGTNEKRKKYWVLTRYTDGAA